jgi:hypothetical protein
VEEINKNLPNSLIPNIQTGAIKETSKYLMMKKWMKLILISKKDP